MNIRCMREDIYMHALHHGRSLCTPYVIVPDGLAASL